MTRHLTRLVRLRALGLVGLVALLPLPGCTHDLLQVTDPDIIPDVNTPSGALALKNGVIFRLEQVTAGLGGNGPDNLFIYGGDRKSTRLNSSHLVISYAVFCLKKKK